MRSRHFTALAIIGSLMGAGCLKGIDEGAMSETAAVAVRVHRTGYDPGKWDWTKHRPENYTECIAAAKAWLNDHAKKLQDSLNEYLKQLEKELDKPNCNPLEVLDAQREAQEQFNKQMAKLGE